LSKNTSAKNIFRYAIPYTSSPIIMISSAYATRNNIFLDAVAEI